MSKCDYHNISVSDTNSSTANTSSTDSNNTNNNADNSTATDGNNDNRDSSNKVTLKTNDTAIELGAIAKGYIADRLKDCLVSQNVKVRSLILVEMFSVLAKARMILLF